MGIIAPLSLKVLAAIAGKALILSKVALTIAGIIALKKIFTKDNHDNRKSFHGIVDADDNLSTNKIKRSILNGQRSDDDHNLPYRHYVKH